MNRELEVLKEIGNYHIGEINYCVKDTIEYSIIEYALSRLEKYDALNLSCDELQFIANIIRNPEHQLDKLKAFEIIKEEINRQALLHLLSIEVKNKEDLDLLKRY